VPDDLTAHQRLAELDPAQTTMVVGQLPVIQPDGSAVVNVVARGEDSVTLRYVSETTNLLRVGIPAFPGWHALSNDSELALRTVDGAFIGVVLPAGEGEVRLVYRPRFFWLGAAISALALVVTLVALLAQGAAQRVEARDDRVHT
jgi:uncharacterized membrane protein YfhO